MKLETLVKTRNAYQKRLEDEKLFISLCNQIGKTKCHREQRVDET